MGINDQYIESLNVVEEFLKEVVQILSTGNFLLQSRVNNDQTLLNLNYDNSDVKRELRNLKIEEYAYSIPDNIKKDEEPYKVFHKIIDNKEIYIKLKVKYLKNGNLIFCMSFHEAIYKESRFPYRV